MATTHNELCPVAAVLSYLVYRHSWETPFFKFSDGSPLTMAKFVSEFCKALSSAGVQADGYTGHSFRIGTAMTAVAKGIPDNMIKALGRWTSEAYQVYIRLLRATGLSYSYAGTVSGHSYSCRCLDFMVRLYLTPWFLYVIVF